MKKRSTVLISTALVLGVMVAPPALAADAPSSALTAGAGTSAAGATTLVLAAAPEYGTNSHWRYLCRLLGLCS